MFWFFLYVCVRSHLAILGVIVPFCHPTVNGFLPLCSFVSLLWSVLPTGCGASGVFLSWHGLPIDCSSAGMSLLRHGLPTGHGTSWAALVWCGSLRLQFFSIVPPLHKWPTVPQGCPCSSMCHPLWPVHGSSWLPSTQSATVTPSYLHWLSQTGAANGKTVRVTWSWLATRLKPDKWTLNIRIRKVRLKPGTESVRMPEYVEKGIRKILVWHQWGQLQVSLLFFHCMKSLLWRGWRKLRLWWRLQRC